MRIGIFKILITLMQWVSPSMAARRLLRFFLCPRRRERPERETVLLASAQATRVTTEVGVLPLWTWGQGPRVFLVHGWEARGAQLGAYVAPLTALGYQVITWDNPAHGDAEGKQSSPWLFARSILAVAEKVGTPHVVIGHSMGALATNLALRHGLRAERLVYLAPGGAPEQGLELMQTRLNVTQATLDVLQPLIAQAAGVTWPDLVLGLVPSDCKTPLLVVHDEDDEEVPISFSERLTQDWAGPVSLVRTQGLGHQRVVWDKNAVQAVADALDRADAVAG